MKRERIWINDTSKLEGLGFTYYPLAEHWSFQGMTVDRNGFVSILSVKISMVMKLVEMGKLGLVEKKAMTKKVNVALTADEYEDFKKWKEKRK